MHRTNEIPKHANKIAAISAAHSFIFNNFENIRYPLKPEDFFTDNYNLLPWTEACAQSGNDDFFDLKKRSADARTIKFQDEGNSLTVFDDTVKNKRRVRFTIAHELGHLELGHLDKYIRTSPSSRGLKQSEYRVLENEADFFAAEILAPIPLIILLKMNCGQEIKNFFQISTAAANNRVKDLMWHGDSAAYLPKLAKFEKLFGGLVDCYLNARRCDTCYAIGPSGGVCVICGGKAGTQLRQLIITGGSYMKYTLFKPVKCAICESSEIKHNDKFCKICGTSLTNFCTACNSQLDGNARYCIKCGEPSEFYVKKYLSDWEIERRKIESRTIENFEFADEYL